MPTKAKYRGTNLIYFDQTTNETIIPVAAVHEREEFLGNDTLVNGTTKWLATTVAGGTAARLTNQAGGVFQLALSGVGEAQDTFLYWGDERGIDLKAGAIFECTVKASVVMGTGVRCVFGLAGDHNLDKDTITESAWFSMSASAVLNAQTDDTSNDETASTGVTMATGTKYVCKIDFTTLSDVRFFVDGVAVATSQTFDMSNLSTAEAIMQPYFSIDKPSGGNLGTLQIDVVDIVANRSS